MSKTRLAALGLVALLLAACGPVHPGAAAVVNGTRISMSDVDDMADLLCASSQGGGGGAQAGIDLANLRRQSVAALLAGEVADGIARDRDYDVRVPAVPAAELAQLEEQFGDDVDTALWVIERNQRTSAIAIEIGREEYPDVKDEEQLFQAGQQLLGQEFEKADITIDPRFGIDDSLQQVAETGSLSVAEITLDATAVEDRPAALQCSA